MSAPTLVERTAERRSKPPRLRMTPRTLAHFRRDPLDFVSRAAALGDVVRFRITGPADSYLVNDPETIHQVLAVHHRRLHKSESVKQAHEILGQGLLSSEDELHANQRRIIQRAFSKAHFERYGAQMQTTIRETEGRWRDGAVVDL